MIDSIIKKSKEKFEIALEHLKIELSGIRTGRATPSLVENLKVDYYGVKTPLKQIANIFIPDPKSVLIQPWDKNTIKNIEKAISESELELTPTIENQNIRIFLPPLSEERRQNLVKVLSKKIEETKNSIRSIREEAWKKIQNLEKEGKISEDDKFKGKDRLQEVVDEYNGKIEEMRKKKEEEIINI